ncbi:MAG: aldehyde ferredoxin oxidoreductase N-terminal domain-containing protein [Pseudomonadota bacterium]
MLQEILVDLEAGCVTSRALDEPARFGKELAVERLCAAADPDATLYLTGYTPTAASGLPFAGKLNLYGVSLLGGNLQGSRSGGLLGPALAKLGIAGIQVTGRSARQRVLLLDPEGRPSLVLLDRYGRGITGTRALAQALYAVHGEQLAVAVVDPARVGFCYTALICSLEAGGMPSRAAARSTTILGHNGLVAIAAALPAAPRVPLGPDRLARARVLQASMARRRRNPALAGNDDPSAPLLGGTYGAAAKGRLEAGHGLCDLFRGARVPDEVFARLLPEAMVREQLALARAHGVRRPRRGCLPGCPNRCDQTTLVPDGQGGVQALKAGEWETCQGLLNLGVFNDLAARAAWVIEHSNLHAYDHIEALVAVAALALATEGGADAGVRYGDWASVRAALEQAASGVTDLGRLLRLGAAAVERHFGLERHFTVGGHALPFHNPRTMLQTGVGLSWTYGRHGECCAGPGRHNFLGLPYDSADHSLPPEAHVLNAVHAMVLYGAMDSAGHCFFMGPSLTSLAELEILWEALGRPLSIPEALRRSARTIQQVHAFDAARGVQLQALPRVFYERATHGNAQSPEQAVAFTVPFPLVRDLGAEALDAVASGAVTPPASLLAEQRGLAAQALAAQIHVRGSCA